MHNTAEAMARPTLYTCTAHQQPKRICSVCHPDIPPKSYEQKVFELFASRVMVTDSCWLWTGGKTLRNYGVFCVRAWRIWAAHRYAYFIFNGPLDENLVLDHRCMNTLCVNPRHLEQVTQQENALRGKQTKLCPHGVRGKQNCSECTMASRRDYRIRNGLQVRSSVEELARRHTGISLGIAMHAQLKVIAAKEGHHCVSRVIRQAVISHYQLDVAINTDSQSEAS
jgi:HNH endonuclease